MVLDDNSPPDDMSSVLPPPSGGDETSSEPDIRSLSRWPITRPNGLQPLYLDLTTLPRPWFKLRWQEASFGNHVQSCSDAAVKFVGRPLKQEEAQSVAFTTANAARIMANGLYVSLAVTAALSWRGTRTFRFPFYTPKWTYFSPNRFLFLRDGWARASWHAVRWNVYMLTAGTGTQMLITSYARRVYMDIESDPRMKDINSLVKQKVLSEALNKLKKDQSAESIGAESLERAEEQEWPRSEGDGGEGQPSEDWIWGTSAENSGGVSPADGSSAGDYQDQSQQTDKRALAEAVRRTDGKAVEAGSSAAPESQPSGSAWDRVRQEAEGQAPRASQHPSRDNAVR